MASIKERSEEETAAKRCPSQPRENQCLWCVQAVPAVKPRDECTSESSESG